MFCSPRLGSVDKRLRKEDNITCLGSWLDNVVDITLEIADVLRDLIEEVGFVTTWNTCKTSIAVVDIGETVANHRHSIPYYTVVVSIIVKLSPTRPSMKDEFLFISCSEDGVIVVKADSWSNKLNEVWKDPWVVDELLKRFSPKAWAFVILDAVVTINVFVQFKNLVWAQDILDNQVAFKIE